MQSNFKISSSNPHHHPWKFFSQPISPKLKFVTKAQLKPSNSLKKSQLESLNSNLDFKVQQPILPKTSDFLEKSQHGGENSDNQLNISQPISRIRSKPSNSLEKSELGDENLNNQLKIPLPINPKSSNSLQKSELGEENSTEQRLPVVICRSGTVSRYFWDGIGLRLVSIDANVSFKGVELLCFDDFGNGLRRLWRYCASGLRDFFLPREINENYLEYVKWKFLHRVFSSALQVLATQAMFRAIGVGFARSLPSAAALNWVLKDGLGRLCRCIYTASLASAFDTNLKRVRFSTSVIFSLSIGLELLTPSFPQYFLLLASVANIAKQISLACYLATGSAVHRSFAVGDNLGEISAKAQIQAVCFDNLGLMLAATLNILLKNNQRLLAGLPFVVYPIFTAIDLYGIYQGLKHVHLQTLTKDRLEIILNTWIRSGYIASPAEVSKEEGVDFFWIKGRQQWPIRIGCLNPKSQIPVLSMMTMRSLCEDDFYFTCIEVCTQGKARSGQPGILLCLREGATTADAILGLLQACYIRKNIPSSGIKWEELVKDSHDCNSSIKDWFKLNEDCSRCAQRDIDTLIEKMSGLGWACKNILLSSQEQMRYSFVDHNTEVLSPLVEVEKA